MKMKKTGDLPGFKLYQRTKKDPIKIAGRLKSSKIQLEITACPDDWNTFKNYYSGIRKKELLNDLWPFMLQAHLKTEKSKIKNRKWNQAFIDLFKTQAALLHKYISYGLKTKAYCKPLEESLKRIIPPERLEAFIIAKGKSKSPYDTIGITKHIVESAYSHWIRHQKINISEFDNFEVTYIYGGQKILNMENISDTLFFVNKVLPYSSRNNPAIEFLQDISEAALVVMNHIKSSKTLSLQKGIIKAAFPSFFTPPKS